MSGRIPHGAKSSIENYLNDEEEDILATFLLKCAAIGYPHSRKEVIAIAQRFCNSRDMDVQVTHGWWQKILPSTSRNFIENYICIVIC